MGLENAGSLGLAAEHIVCTDLLLAGHAVGKVDNPTLPFDLVLCLPTRLLRLQVKGTQHPVTNPHRGATPRYRFPVRQTYRTEADILALVAMDIRRVVYMPTARLTCRDETQIYFTARQFEIEVPGSLDRALAFVVAAGAVC